MKRRRCRPRQTRPAFLGCPGRAQPWAMPARRRRGCLAWGPPPPPPPAFPPPPAAAAHQSPRPHPQLAQGRRKKRQRAWPRPCGVVRHGAMCPPARRVRRAGNCGGWVRGAPRHPSPRGTAICTNPHQRGCALALWGWDYSGCSLAAECAQGGWLAGAGARVTLRRLGGAGSEWRQPNGQTQGCCCGSSRHPHRPPQPPQRHPTLTRVQG